MDLNISVMNMATYGVLCPALFAFFADLRASKKIAPKNKIMATARRPYPGGNPIIRSTTTYPVATSSAGIKTMSSDLFILFFPFP
jgi:hypothetical protein